MPLKSIPYLELHAAPDNVRSVDNVGDLDGLSDSIVELGLLQPIKAQRNGDGFEIIDGFRRYLAIGMAIKAKRLDAEFKVPCYVEAKVDDGVRTAQMLVANLQRQDLTPFDEYQGFIALANTHGWTVADIAARTGVSKSLVKDRVSWGRLPDHVIEALASDSVNENNVHRVGFYSALAALPLDEIEKLCADDKVPTHHDVRQAESMRARAAEARKITKLLTDHHHFVTTRERAKELAEMSITDSADLDSTEQCIRGELHRNMAAAEADENISLYNSFWSTYNIEEKLVDLPPGKVFTIKVGQYNVTVEQWTTRDVTTTTASGRPIVDEVDVEALDPMSRAEHELNELYAAAEEQWRVQHDEFQQNYVQTTKPAQLSAMVLGYVIGDDQYSRPQRVAELLGVDKDTDLVDYARQSAANLARTAAAFLISRYYKGLEIEGEPTPPDADEYVLLERPQRSDYQTDEDHAEAVAEIEALAAEAVESRIVDAVTEADE